MDLKMDFKTFCLLAFAFTHLLRGMDTPPKYERLRHVLDTEGANHREAFIEACYAGYTDLVAIALTRPDSKEFRNAGLVQACYKGKTSVVQLLLKESDLDLDENTARECLRYAAGRGHSAALDVLFSDPRIGAHADIPVLLQVAVENRQIQVIKKLQPKASLEQIEAAIERATGDPNTIHGKDIHTVKALMSYPGVKLHGPKIRSLFIEACISNDVELATTILAGYDLKPEKYRTSAVACYLGRTEIVRQCLKYPRLVNFWGDSELEHTIEFGYLEILQLLLGTPLLASEVQLGKLLSLAIKSYRYDILGYLLKPHNDMDATAGIDLALDTASELRSVVMTKLLLADPRCNPETLNDPGDIEFVKRLQHATVNKDAYDVNGYLVVSAELLAGMLEGVVEEDMRSSYIFGVYCDAGALGNLEVVQVLANHFDCEQHMDCMDLACQHGHSDVVKFLLDNKFVDSEEFIASASYSRFFEDSLAVSTFTSVLDASEINHDVIDEILSGLVILGDAGLFKDLLQKYGKLLTPNDLKVLLHAAEQSRIYNTYKMILDCDSSLSDPEAMINMTSLCQQMIYVKAGRIEMLPELIPIEDLDVLVYQAARNSQMAKHFLDHQILYIKGHYNCTFKGELCNHTTGSEGCRAHIETDVWPILDDLLPLLRIYRPMRTDKLEGVIIFLMFLVESGWTGERIRLMVGPLSEYSLD